MEKNNIDIMHHLRQIGTDEFLTIVNQGIADGIVNLRNIDFTFIELRPNTVRNRFIYMTSAAAKATKTNPLCIDLTGTNISGLDFSNFDLTNTIMNSATAQHTIFTNSDLTDVKIDDANVDYADFRNTNLTYTKFHNTSIVGANFTSADLSKTYGLGFNNDSVSYIIQRLGVCASIKGAILPKLQSKLKRNGNLAHKIEQEINKNNPNYTPDNPFNKIIRKRSENEFVSTW